MSTDTDTRAPSRPSAAPLPANTPGLSEFWRLADTAKTQTEYLANERLHRLADAPFDVLQKILIQYRYFTIFYITDLALLVAKLPFGELRSLLADFLNDELGNGDHDAAHERLYDNFLMSLGLDAQELDRDPNRANLRLLDTLQQRVTSEGPAYAVGLRGMGGECLCQIYLAAMHEHFSKNPAIRERAKDLDWVFWDIHTGEVDIAHREKLKAALHEYVLENPDELPELVRGYVDAKSIFEQFWENIYSDYLGPAAASKRRAATAS
ncbi:iron-containing redox enzyme family protein [Haliangium sp.]|uniref:iron-containing redox enzyme family protein n=1 Tax=Haliangium sp. TaxID=2663208 RepID=UPI003D111345